MWVLLGNEWGFSGSLMLQGVVIRQNSVQGASAAGGGLYLEGWSQSSFSLKNVTIADNSVESDSYAGAGLEFESGDYGWGGEYSTLVIQDSIIKTNVADPLTITTGHPWGGGIDIRHGKLTLLRSTLSNNAADYGGGISVDGVKTHCDLVNSTISGNKANLDGGGIYSFYGTIVLFSSTVMSNYSDLDLNGSGQGGGIFQTGSASVTLNNSLLIANHESYFNPLLKFWMRNLGDLRGGYTSGGYNGFSDTKDATFSGSHSLDRYDITLTRIGPLANNGGDTPTHALLNGSEAINAGNPAGCIGLQGNPLVNDQRGYPRVMESRCDIGAYEHNPMVYLPLIRR
jgi:hypothetical protein